MQLSERAMLVSLTMRKWTARRIDKKVTQEVHAKHGTKSNVGRYNKCLIDPEAESFVKIEQLDNQIRDYHYKHTLPWTMDGVQILSSEMFFEYAEQMGRFSSQRRDLVDAFIAEFPALVRKAKADLNGMFRESDYPSEYQLRGRYEFDYKVMPMPEAGDFRVSLGDTQVKAIRQQIEENQKRAAEQAMAELWDRLYQPVKHMATTLADAASAKRSKNSLVDNVAEIAGILPLLNIGGDQRLNALAQEVSNELTQHHASVLRNTDAVRTEIASKADEIARRMAAIMGE